MNTKISIAIVLFALLAPYCLLHAQEEKPPRQMITPERYDVTIRPVSGALNSSDDDFSPMIIGSGRVMYFTSTRNGSQDIFTAIAGYDGWEQIQRLGEPLNTSADEGSSSITPDGHWMVFTGCGRPDALGDCDLYIAEYGAGMWRNVRNLGPNVNSPFWESQPAISSDGLTILFTSDRPGGQGGTDLWMTTRSHGGDWRPAVNLGAVINTVGDELAPAIAADNRTLYFSSDQHPGIGGLDIYQTTSGVSGWSAPRHMGVPVNTSDDDYFCGLSLNSQDMYFASSRAGGQGDLDIWLAVPNPLPPSPVTTVTGRVHDHNTDAPLGATLTVRDVSTNSVVSSFHSDDMDGSYVVVLQPGRDYVITAEAAGYLFYSDRFTVPAGSGNDMIRKDVPMTRDLVRLLVFFDFDKATLQSESYVDLDRAAEWLKSNPNVSVEVAGHTDNVGARDYNKKLSQNRAEAVVQYLIGKGISSSRLRAAGYGMEQPTVTNDTEEGRAQNRRVEFRVVSR
ncbi:MAG: OmpA family protein [Bacteroidia bacterium]|nr:OmpA family protein [Bacteroidia bacterium]